MFRTIAGTFLALALHGDAHAQGIERLLVEPYAVTPMPDGAPMVTWRLYVDLAPGYTLQMVYGERHNQLELATTTSFHNDSLHGDAWGDRIAASKLGEGLLALDSWLTICAATDRHRGVPLDRDTDGSLLECPPFPDTSILPPGQRPLCVADGLVAKDSVRQVVDFRMPTGYLRGKRGNVIHTMDGAWAVLGGTKGEDEDNLVLIAQLSTTGALRYMLNVQLRHPDGTIVRYVSTVARNADERLEPMLKGTAPSIH